MTREEIINMVNEECKNANLKYLIQIDNGENVVGRWDVRPDSNLHDMARDCMKRSFKSEEQTI